LIVCAGVIVKLSPIWVALIVIGYGICDDVHRRLVQRARWEIIENDLYDWKPLADGSNEPDREEKGTFVRVKLSKGNDILFARIAELLWRIP